MTEKHYDTDWAKAKSRDLVGKMLDQTLLTFRKPSQIRVLHFGGVDLAEARQVYLPRGILPKNIVSVEREKDLAEKQRAQGTGIEVVHSTLDEYVANPKIPVDFDVVSLDYTGPVLHSELELIRSICSRQKRNTFLLHTANLIRRDHKTNVYYLIAHASDGRRGLNAEERKLADQLSYLPPQIVETAARHLNMYDKLENKAALGDIKPSSYHKIINLGYSSLLGNDGDIQRMFDFVAGKDREMLARIMGHEAGSIFPDMNVNPDGITDFSCSSSVTMQFFNLFISRILESKLKDSGINIPAHTHLLNFAIPQIVSGVRAFFEVQSQGYSYISESGSPMVGEIVLVRRPYQFNASLDEIGRQLNFPRSLEIRYPEGLLKALRATTDHYVRELLDKRLEGNYPSEEVIFLGNASKPVLTKRRFIQELEAGKDSETIKSQYRGWGKMPLAAWQAHYTMGTYQSRSMVEHNGEDSDLEKISKEDAVDLLSSGYPPEEIHSAWPTSYTVGQLRAFKAHITMGTYSEEQK